MPSKAKTVQAFLDELAPVRRKVVEALRHVILAHLDRDCEESMQYGMIGYNVPHRVYPKGYHANPKLALPYAALEVEKGHFSLYLMAVYGDPELQAWLRQQWALSGRKLDMDQGGIRFKKLEDLPLELIGELLDRMPVAAYIARYEEQLAAPPQEGDEGDEGDEGEEADEGEDSDDGDEGEDTDEADEGEQA